jgi:hypothetical protein
MLKRSSLVFQKGILLVNDNDDIRDLAEDMALLF